MRVGAEFESHINCINGDFGFILLHPTTITTSPPQLVLNHGGQADLVPLPSPEGCGPILILLNEGKRDGEEGTRGGTHEMGGLVGGSRKRSFRPFLVPYHHSPPHPTPTTTQTAMHGPMATQRANQRRSGRINDMVSESTTQQVNQRHGERINNTAHKSTTR